MSTQLQYRVVPAADPTDWFAGARAALTARHLPEGVDEASMHRLVLDRKPVQLPQDLANNVIAWATTLPNWPEGPAPVRIEGLSLGDDDVLRSRWSTALWVSENERDLIRAHCARTGVSVSRLLIGAALREIQAQAGAAQIELKTRRKVKAKLAPPPAK